jgi:hypothetical protein
MYIFSVHKSDAQEKSASAPDMEPEHTCLLFTSPEKTSTPDVEPGRTCLLFTSPKKSNTQDISAPLPFMSSPPQKCVASDNQLSSPTPAKRRATYGDIKDNIVRFNEQVQTTCKATLYDLSVGDKQSVTNALHSLLGQSKYFIEKTLPLINKEELNFKAMLQKNSTLSAYNLNLHRENNDLRRKVQEYSDFESAMGETLDKTRSTGEKKEDKKESTDLE